MEFVVALRTILALALIAFAPGYAWLRLFAPQAGRAERIVGSVGLSVALVVLCLVVGGLFRVPITLPVIIGEALALTAAPLGWSAWRARRARAAR